MFVAIDLGGTSTRAAVGRGDGTILASCKTATPTHDGTEALIEAMIVVAGRACAEAGVPEDAILGWGVGTSGAVDHRTGVVHASPTLPIWEMPLRDQLERRTGRVSMLGTTPTWRPWPSGATAPEWARSTSSI